ncbi:MAG: TolC family protein [Burkholderiaceae bacterium]
MARVRPGGPGRGESAQAALIGARANLEEQERLVTESLRTAWQDWVSTGRRARIASGQIVLAKELVETYREQFRIGRRNLLDLLNAFNELALAESGSAAVSIDSLIARIRLEYAASRMSRLFGPASPQ